MRLITTLLRRFAVWQFKRRGFSTIANIGNDAFSSVLASLESAGWKVYARYGGFDAGIDYDCIRLKRAGIRLKCEWDPWDAWSIEGPATVIQQMADQFGLVAQPEWRWRLRDQPLGKS